MTDHHNHQHLRLDNLRSTACILRRTASSFAAHPVTFLFLTLLLFSFRCLVDQSSLRLTSFIDRDPTLPSLLARLPHTRHHVDPTRHHHRRPFLHFTRVGTLYEDFFSTEDDNRYPHDFPFTSPINGTTFKLSGFDVDSGFSHPIADNEIFFPQFVRPGVVFSYPSSGHDDEKKENVDEPDRNRVNDVYRGEENEKEYESVAELRVFIKGLEISRRDAAALLFLVSFMSAAYGWLILGFTAVYSLVLGVVFVTVVNDLAGRFCSFSGSVGKGSRLGLKRVTGFVLMKWAVRDALTQLVGLWFFSEVEDQYSFFRLFVRLKLMPFTVTPPWIRGFQKEISGFLFSWFLLDVLVSLILAVDGYVAIADLRRRGREIMKEGLYLIWIMLPQAIQIKSFEAVLCGSFAKWVLVHAFGNGIAAVFQSAMEVYFMMAWLIFYFAARCKGAHMEGRRFGRRELEGLIDRLR